MTGQVAKISTDCAGDIVLKVVVPKECVSDDVFRYLNEMVNVELQKNG